MSSWYGSTSGGASPNQGFIPVAPGSEQQQHTPVIPSPMGMGAGGLPQQWHPGGPQYASDWMGFGDASHQGGPQVHPHAFPQWMQQRPTHHQNRPSQDQIPPQAMYAAGHPWAGAPSPMPPLMQMHGGGGGGPQWAAPAGPPPLGMAGHAATPMTGMMHPAMLAGTPMMYPQMFYPSPGMGIHNLEEPAGMPGFRQSNRPKAGRTDEGVFVDKWEGGPHYGPILNRSMMKLLKVTPEINPILLPPNAREGADGPYLEWNMLFPDSQIRRSTDPDHVSWSVGRKAPATFPRTDTLTIVSPYFGWAHTIKHNKAISCQVLMTEIYKFLHSFTGPHEYQSLPPQVQQTIYASYQSNRSRGHHVPGGNLPQQMLKIDFLRNNTMFEGITMDHGFGNERLNLRMKGKGGEDNCVLVLLCGPRHPMGGGGGGGGRDDDDGGDDGQVPVMPGTAHN